MINGFIAEENGLIFYNRRAIINLVLTVVYLDDCGNELAFGFDGDTGVYYFRVYDEREGQLIKNWASQITRTGNNLILNISSADVTFADLGKYFFEIGYNRTGYETPLRYGPLKVV